MAIKGIDNLFGHKNQRTIAKWSTAIGAGLMLNELFSIIPVGIGQTILGPVRVGHVVGVGLALTAAWFWRNRF